MPPLEVDTSSLVLNAFVVGFLPYYMSQKQKGKKKRV